MSETAAGNVVLYRRLYCFIVLVALALLTACSGGSSMKLTVVPITPTDSSKPGPETIATYQSEIALTAAWVVTLTPAYSPSATPGSEVGDAPSGTPFLQQTGECVTQAGEIVNYRQGFCMVTPNTWVVLNVDGGLAGFLKTTPGQTISLVPDWAETSADCHLLIFVTKTSSISTYLSQRYTETKARNDLTKLTPVQPAMLGDMGVIGYAWGDESGGAGGVFATAITENNVLQISFGGSKCPTESLLPVIATLRLN